MLKGPSAVTFIWVKELHRNRHYSWFGVGFRQSWSISHISECSECSLVIMGWGEGGYCFAFKKGVSSLAVHDGSKGGWIFFFTFQVDVCLYLCLKNPNNNHSYKTSLKKVDKRVNRVRLTLPEFNTSTVFGPSTFFIATANGSLYLIRPCLITSFSNPELPSLNRCNLLYPLWVKHTVPVLCSCLHDPPQCLASAFVHGV